MASTPALYMFLPLESALDVARAHEYVREEGTGVVTRVSGPPRREAAGVAIGMGKPFTW